jgi:hypothetical protein
MFCGIVFASRLDGKVDRDTVLSLPLMLFITLLLQRKCVSVVRVVNRVDGELMVLQHLVCYTNAVNQRVLHLNQDPNSYAAILSILNMGIPNNLYS